MLAILFLLIESFFLYKLYKKFGLRNAIVLIYTIVYFYCNAIVFDMILFVKSNKINYSYITIDSNTLAYNLVLLSYFIFFVVYYFCFISYEEDKSKYYKKNKSNYFLYIVMGVIFLIILRNSTLTRIDLKASGNILTTTINFFILFYSAYLFFCINNIKKALFYIYSISLILYCIFTYEREPIVFCLILLLIKYNRFINLKYLLPIGIVGVYILAYYKAFYQIILTGLDSSVFFDYISDNPILLSSLDPAASFSLLYDYFDSRPVLYYNYDFTYFTSFIDQIKSLFGFGTTESMSKVVSKHYVGDSYGLAYSMILESLINFWFFGPVFLAVMTKVIYTFLKRKFYYLNEVIDLICIIFFLSFVRTELIVMTKIFIFPMIIFLTIVHFYYLKNKKLWIQK